MPDALIGFTGFVGGNLLRQKHFDDLYNSGNIEQIAGREYELLVCAGAPAEKWKANRDPEKDREIIQRLLNCLEKVRARETIVISTVDVYPTPIDVDERTVIDERQCSPYGKHRLMIERAAVSLLQATVVRLPGLFGKGIKKNIVFDLLHGNDVRQIHSESIFQFYDLRNLWADVETSRRYGLKLINFATEPTSVREIAAAAFNIDFNNRPHNMPARYNFKSCNAGLFGGSNGYLYSREQVLSALTNFLAEERSRS